MTLRVNVASLTCQQEYVEDFKKVVEKLFSLDEAADVHLEIVDIPATYTEDKKICEWKCNADRGDKWELTLPPGLRTKAAGEEVTLIVSVTEPDKVLSAAKDPKTWSNLWKDAMSELPENGLKPVDTDVLEVYPLLGGNSVTLKQCYKKNSASKDAFFENCLRHKEARVAMMQLGRRYTCKKDCAKGVCQFKDASRYEDDQVERGENVAIRHDKCDITYPDLLFESATRSVSDPVSVCFMCGYLCQEPPRCFKEGVCGGDGVCSMPGRRAGHAASSFFFNGGPSVLLLYGGEIYESEDSTVRKLTDDIVTGWFDGSSVTWARMNLDCPQSWSCPAPRRDMSISIFDSRAGSRLHMCLRLDSDRFRSESVGMSMRSNPELFILVS